MAEPRTVEQSQVTFARGMTQMDANYLGNVHGGVIMRMVDEAAGAVAARHAGNPSVTASVDNLSFLAPVHVGDIVVVKAAITCAWTTSMEIGVRVEAEPFNGDGERRHTTTAYLTFVALDGDGRPTPVPPLVTSGELEERRRAQAEIRRQVRSEARRRIGSWRDGTVRG